MGAYPCDRETDGIKGIVLRESAEPLNGLSIKFSPIAGLIHSTGRKAPGACRFQQVLAGQQAAGDGAIWHHGKTLAERHRQNLRLTLAFQQVVHRLNDRDRFEVVFPGNRYGLHGLPCREVAETDIKYLSLSNEVIHRGQRLEQRRSIIEMVQVEDVDVVGPKAIQAAVNGFREVETTEAARIDV